MDARRFVLCLDGTWNNAYKKATRDDGTKVVKPSNPLKLARAVLPRDDAGIEQITYYDTGVGSMGRYPGLPNRLLGLSDKYLGGATGAGFEANVEQAATFLANNFVTGDQVYVFGFSRGAAQARALTRFIDWMGGMPTKNDAYFIPLYFRDYVDSGGRADPALTTTSSGRRPDGLQPIRIDLLGVWDTVLAHGGAWLLGSRPASCVVNARHAVAVDEKRYIFLPEIWQGAQPGQSMEQRWFPGVHSNVGGGYLDDGLANVSLRWMLGEAERLGLAMNRTFVGFYRPWPQGRYYESKDVKYTLWDGIRLKNGVRSLIDQPASANLTLDDSVLQRIASDYREHEQMDAPYRPRNVREYLRETGQADLLPPEWR